MGFDLFEITKQLYAAKLFIILISMFNVFINIFTMYILMISGLWVFSLLSSIVLVFNILFFVVSVRSWGEKSTFKGDTT